MFEKKRKTGRTTLALLAFTVAVHPAFAQEILELRGSLAGNADTLSISPMTSAEQTVALPPPPALKREQAKTGPAGAKSVVTPVARFERIVPISPVPVNRRPVDDDPFAAHGIRAGSFVLRPSVESGMLATSNATSSAGGDSAVVSQTTLRLNAKSQWSVDEIELNAYGTFERSVSGQDLEQTEGAIEFSAMRELTKDLRLKSFASYAIRPESFSSPVEVTGAIEQPVKQTITSSVGLSKDAGKLRLGIAADVEREIYGSARLANGLTVSQGDRDNIFTSARLRAGYEIAPALMPFAELRIGRRDYDNSVDSAGYERSADHIEAKVGLTFDRGEKFFGEVALGYIREKPEDDRLGAVDGLSASADINWSPVRGTNVKLLGTTQVEGSTTPGVSGSILYSGTASVERKMRANLTGSLAAGVGYRDYQSSGDNDTIYSAEAVATYWFNRYLGLTARARHENVNSTLPNRDASTNSLYVGLKAQR